MRNAVIVRSGAAAWFTGVTLIALAGCQSVGAAPAPGGAIAIDESRQGGADQELAAQPQTEDESSSGAAQPPSAIAAADEKTNEGASDEEGVLGPSVELLSQAPLGDDGDQSTVIDAADQQANEAGAASTGAKSPDEGKHAKAEHVQRLGRRPKWWIEKPEHREGRLFVAASALGADVLSARRAAIDAGRKAIEALVKGSSRTERIELATVRPLPAMTNSQDGARFVGYVLISIADADQSERRATGR